MKHNSVALTGYEEGPYYSRDIKAFQENNGLSTTELADVFCRDGMSASAFKKCIECDDDILSPTLQMLLRLYSRYPEIVPRPERFVTSEFFETELGGEAAIASRFRGVLFGVDRNSGYNWNRDSFPSAQVKTLMWAAKNLKQIKCLNQHELLQELIFIFNATTKSLGVNPMKTGSWGRKKLNEEPLNFEVSDVSDKAVKNRGRRINLVGGSKLTSKDISNLIATARAKLCNLIK